MEIILKDVSYKNILKNINLTFKENEITSIIGKNGSGRAELLKLIYDNTAVDKGEIIVNSKGNNNVNRLTHDKNKNVFYLGQDYENKLFNINVLEDIRYGNKKIDEEKLYQLLKLFNLDSKILAKNYLEISSGEKKKITLILMLLNNAKIILLDSLTCSLDYKSIQTLLKLLKREKRTGKIIIITDEDSDFLMEVSDRVVAIDNKRVIVDDSKFKVFEDEKLLRKIYIKIPNISSFRNRVLDLKSIKLEHRDNINDLIKDIYRHAK